MAVEVIGKVRFAADSLVEREGFEPSVPVRGTTLFETAGFSVQRSNVSPVVGNADASINRRYDGSDEGHGARIGRAVLCRPRRHDLFQPDPESIGYVPRGSPRAKWSRLPATTLQRRSAIVPVELDDAGTGLLSSWADGRIKRRNNGS